MKNRGRAYAIKSKYNISWQEYLELYEQQQGCCAICGRHESELKLKRNLDIDHNHKTNKVRGLLCNKCNMGLGCFQDNTEVVLNAAAYLYDNKDGGVE